MFRTQKYFQAENQACQKSYRQTISRIKRIHKQTAKKPRRRELEEYFKFFHLLSGIILEAARLERSLRSSYFRRLSFDELKEQNRKFFNDILSSNYPTSYADPSYAVKIFGQGYGQLMSYFYIRYSQYLQYALLHMTFMMERNNRAFIDVFEYLMENPLDYQPLRDRVTAETRRLTPEDISLQIKQGFDPEFGYYRDVLLRSDLSDLRYLFRYGRYITDNEIRVAKFLQNYSPDRIRRLAKQIANAYLQGFVRDNKDRGSRNSVILVYPAGYEAIARALLKEMEKKGFKVLISQPRASKVNEQYSYDHRFDEALYLDGGFVDDMVRCYSQAADSCRALLERYSGVVILDKFGELPFSPADKPECLKYSPEQLPLRQRLASETIAIHERYCPRKNTSFTAIAFPAPEIGGNFEQVFDDIMQINLLDSKKHTRIQSRIIAALDKAEYVRIIGRNDNRTDMTVRLQKIEDRQRQTNFVNCGADVNIPLGEVFTSPRLEGTEGTLHVGQAFLKGLKYQDLFLKFKDGYIVEYGCSNFSDPEQNKKYIEENLLFPHKTLPLGEFAIGTNTLAYVLAQKHGIMDLLPVLIIEKMGPHLAIGDTCFSREEDHPVYNPDGKEVIARENERTAQRHQDSGQAYTHVHTDITLPYESIGRIAAVLPNGRQLDIIRDGRFVLKGTEVLNKPFDV